MCEIRVPQVKYSLLLDKQSQFTGKRALALFAASLIAICCILYGIYYFTFFPKENVHFPEFPMQVPPHNLRRALEYNKVTNASYKSKISTNQQTKVSSANDYKLICYYNFPDKDATNKYVAIEYLDANLCTHINLAFANIVNNSINLDEFKLQFSQSVMELKKINKALKVMLSIGGSGNDRGFPGMVLNHENRKTFIKSIVNIVKVNKFDGIDLDWEFPNEDSHSDGKQRMHFTQLLHEIRSEINRQQKHKFLLSVAVAAPQFLIDTCYDIPYMNQYVDFINLMSYDYHFYTKFTPYTGINAPLYSDPSEMGYFSTLNINFSANYWHANGMDKNKIIIGLPTYGHTFTLTNTLNNRIKAPAKDYGRLGTSGFANYQQVCWFIKANQIVPVFDEITKSPYASKLTEWISFDNVDSIGYKTQYIKENNFGGAMLYALNTDDYQGACSDGKRQTFPLTRKVKEILDDADL